ncbi:formiminoglutamase [Kineosphaera limosa]|uniref:Formimidoylglutamase n=1 Tax=Kineosphaera limosa NBRC 100340 TaxID=1184609 RepID=K6WQ95_9MICO|nr:formimidoylglutamase [Kineosphaera limosa]NYE02484.1 formiminoglutamase [Kineosphaera limosa]GAB95991.1 formimidoylglutamase [Kineosphaera limosa NBRC 100340]
MTIPTDPTLWTGRIDGEGPEHARWHQRVSLIDPTDTTSGDVALVGFASQEGVRRNKGRPGAAAGPDALRRALASLPLHTDAAIDDLGTVTLDGEDLEGAQQALGEAVARALRTHRLVVVLGGGHETAFGSYLGWSAAMGEQRVGILNLDAHFDLREAPRASSGTPFLQAARAQAAAGRDFRYAVLGISEAANTAALFDTARALNVPWLLDHDCQPGRSAQIAEFVARFMADLDVVHLTIDLDVLPAAVAPGVSAPAAYGVPVETIVQVCRQVAGSGKLALVDVVELCPPLDQDSRTARTAARLVHEIVHGLAPIPDAAL